MTGLDTGTATIEFALPWVLLACTSAVLALASWAALERGRLYAVVLGALSMYGFITAAELPGLAAQISERAALTAVYVYTVGAVLFLGSIVLVERRFPRPQPTRMADWAERLQRAGSQHLTWSLIAGGASLVLFLASRQSLELTWSEARSEAGVVEVAATFLFLLAVPGVTSGVLAGKRLRAAGLLAISLIVFVLSGSRAAVLGALASFAWIALARAERRARRIGILAGIAALAFLAHFTLRILRGFGPAALLAAWSDGDLAGLFAQQQTGAVDVSGGEAAIAKYFVFAVKHAGDDVFGFMTSVQRLLMLFVPKAVGVAKPIDVTYQLWSVGFGDGLFDGAQGFVILQDAFISGSLGSLHPTLFGELFVAGRWPALVVSSILFGALSVLIDRAVRRMSDVSALLLLGPILIGMLMVGRGNSVIGYGYFFYLGAFVVPVNAVLARLGRLLRPVPQPTTEP